MFYKNKKICITFVLMIILGVILGNGTVLSTSAESVDKEKGQIVTINEDNNGQQIDLKIGQILVVELNDKELNAEETDFSWKLSEEPKYTLNLYNSFTNKDENKECWVFNVNNEGAVDLNFKSDDKNFKVYVTVKKEIVVIYSGANGSQINIIKGQKLKIVLPSKSTTGYSWNFTQVPDKSIVKRISNYYTSFPILPGVGAKETSNFVFDTLGVGKTKIELKYARSYSIENTAEDTYFIYVNVVESTNDNPEIIKIGEENNGKELTVPVGKIIKIELDKQEVDKMWNNESKLDNNVIKEICAYSDTNLAKDCYAFITKGEGVLDLKFYIGNKSYVVKIIVKQIQGVFIDQESNGKEVVIKKGDILEIALEGNGSAIHSWRPANSSFGGVLEVEGNRIVQYPILIECGGYVQYWKFSGITVGTTSIDFKYMGVDGLDLDNTYFSVKVRVIDDEQPSPTPHADYFLEGYVKTDGIGEGINKGYKVESVGGSWSAYTDEDGKFTTGVIVLKEDQVYKLKITKGNCLERIVDFTCGKTITMWPGDLAVSGAQDKCINFMDVMAIAKAFNAQPSEERYNTDCDLNCDGSINMADVIMIAKHFNAVSSDYGELK